MIGKWMRLLFGWPFALMCRRFPLWPFRATITQPVGCVTYIRIDNLLTRLLSRFSGGYDYAVCYLVDASDADGPKWIASLEAVLKLRPEWLLDAHGTIFCGEQEVERQLRRKLDFLIAIRNRVREHATHGQTIQQLTRKVFNRRDLVDWLSLGDGWLSLITRSDFSRAKLFKSFLRDSAGEESLNWPSALAAGGGSGRA